MQGKYKVEQVLLTTVEEGPTCPHPFWLKKTRFAFHFCLEKIRNIVGSIPEFSQLLI